MLEDFTLSVIVPVFNERVTFRKLIERVRAVPIRKEIVIVDDASNDGTTELIRDIAATWGDDPNNSVRTIFHEQNAGKGAAIRSAIPEVSGEITIIQDADLEYSPEEYPQLIGPIVAGDADVVYGSRFVGAPRRVLFFRHTLGNQLLTFLSNLCTDLNLTDMETCYKVFRTGVLRRVNLVSNRFGIEPEITAKIARLGCRVYEVPITYNGREYWEGKKIGWRDGVAAVWTILKYAIVDDRENLDPGYRALRKLRSLQRYNEWVWSRVSPFVGDRVLEVGCGIGSFTRFMRNRDCVVATDKDQESLSFLRGILDGYDNIKCVQVDWEDPNVAELTGFDTVLCVNVLEHIEQEDQALASFANLLEPDGRLVLQVPAMPRLYGETDRALGHLRRYDRDHLSQQLRRHGFEVECAHYHNVPGVLGWYLNSQVFRRGAFPGWQARLMNLMVPWLQLEARRGVSFGTTLIVVGRKERVVA